MRTVKLTKETKENLLNDLLKRSPNNYTEYADTVQAIVDDVRENKDQALFAYTEKFDHAKITGSNVKVTKEEIEAAYNEVDPHLVEVIRKALANIRTYHEKQKQYSWFDSGENGTMLGQKVTPLHSVGICSGRKGSISFFCIDEYCTGKGSRCSEYYYDHTL